MAAGPANPSLPTSAGVSAAGKTAGWVAANLVAVLTVAGAVFYVALRLAYETFYGRLQLTPEDVGIGYGDALVRAAGMAFYVGLAAVFLLGSVLYSGRGRRVFSHVGPRQARLLAGGCVVAAIAILFSLMWAVANNQASQVEHHGHTGTPFFFLDTGIRAEKANISWLVKPPPQPLEDLPNHQLAFLGSSGGTVVLYDTEAKKSFLIPSNDVTLSLKD
jgi:hypothetical protein